MAVRKYDYDIKEIESQENQGYSVRDIARYEGWCEINTQAWIKRNYTKKVTVKYTLKSGKSKSQ